MKLFYVDYMEDMDSNSYLKVGEDSDTEDSIKEKELLGFLKDIDCLYYVGVNEIKEVDGYKVILENK